MAWYEEARFYHIYPLGLTGAPEINDYGEPVHRLKVLDKWIDHLIRLHINALYIGPLFESGSHGYDTTDYKKVDSRLGTNDDLKSFVKKCHDAGIKVILDGVFNHTGRDFFAFKDIQKNRESSRYKDWYLGVNFSGNNEYNDGFSYENWGGYNLLVKLNQYNQEVKDYIGDVIRFWVDEFDIDGLRLDAADVLQFDYIKHLRYVANSLPKEDFYLMGEVIHGEYNRWVTDDMLHSVTNYPLHKALFSGFNSHNFFEIAHTHKRSADMGLNRPDGGHLYNFTDNHDVERIINKLSNRAHYKPVHIMLYTLPGIPSIYYGSEFGIEGKKEAGSDASLRPAIDLDDYADAYENNEYTKTIVKLGSLREHEKALDYGTYRELTLTTTAFCYERVKDESRVIVMLVNSDERTHFDVEAANGCYTGIFSGTKTEVTDGRLRADVSGNDGEVYVLNYKEDDENTTLITEKKAETNTPDPIDVPDTGAACEIISEHLKINDDGILLDTVIERPANISDKVPMCVILHGFTGNKNERHIIDAAKTMQQHGYATLRADLYGHGESDGEFRDHNLYKWINNAITLIDYCRGLDYVSKVYLCGHSQGGLTAILTAAIKHDVISALIALSPALSIPDDAKNGHVLGADFDPNHIPDEIVSPDGWVLSGNHCRISQTIDIEKAIDAYDGPVLIIHGAADDCIPVRCSEDAAKRYKNSELVIVPDDTHCYDVHPELVKAALEKWLVIQ